VVAGVVEVGAVVAAGCKPQADTPAAQISASRRPRNATVRC